MTTTIVRVPTYWWANRRVRDGFYQRYDVDSLDMNPPASGPEVELRLRAIDEQALRGFIESIGGTVLAIKTIDEKGITVEYEDDKTKVMDTIKTGEETEEMELFKRRSLWKVGVDVSYEGGRPQRETEMFLLGEDASAYLAASVAEKWAWHEFPASAISVRAIDWVSWVQVEQ